MAATEIQESDFRALLLSLKDLSLKNDFIAVCENVEIANMEVALQVGQLPFGARLHIDKQRFLWRISPHKTTSSRAIGRKGIGLALRVKVKACRRNPSSFAVTALTGVSELEVEAKQL